MASFLELIDNTLGTHFNTPAYDPEKGRRLLVKEINKAADQFANGRTRVPNRAWEKGNNNAVSFAPKLGGKPVLIAGQDTNYVQADRFPEFLDGLKAAVTAGDLDDEIKAALEGGEGTTPTTAKAGKAKGEGFPKHLRSDWDKLEAQQKRNLGIWWGKGKNPDQSLRSLVGDKPDAPYVAASK